MENNMIYLNLTSQKEEIKMINNQSGLYITNTGRIYSYYNNCSVKFIDGEYKLIVGEQLFPMEDLQKICFPNASKIWNKQEFKYINIDYNQYMLDKVYFYTELSDKFMLYLIENGNMSSFEETIRQFSFQINLRKFSKETIYSLLKPVYVRYERYDKVNLFSLAESIRNPEQPRKLPTQIVLYDVPCVVNNSRLKLLDNFELNLRDYIMLSPRAEELNCLYLGNIEQFKFVNIKIAVRKKLISIEITLTGYGYTLL